MRAKQFARLFFTQLLLVVTAWAWFSRTAEGSSHREAPAIALDAPADPTDVYLFKSPQRSSTHVVAVANFYPGLLPAAGPNFYRFDDTVVYEIHFATRYYSTLVYQFVFTTSPDPIGPSVPATSDPASFFRDSPVAFPPGLTYNSSYGRYTHNLSQTYSIRRFRRNAEGLVISQVQELANGIPVAPNRIGPFVTDGCVGLPVALNNPSKANPAQADSCYTALAANAIRQQSTPTGELQYFFAGPRNDPFYVDLGGAFDSLNIRVPALGTGTPKDALKGLNVMSIVMEIPVSELGTALPSYLIGEVVPAGEPQTIGTWSATYRRTSQSAGNTSATQGIRQIAKLGNPLMNELLVLFKDKNLYNRLTPYQDVTTSGYLTSSTDPNGRFRDYLANPRLINFLNLLYGKTGTTLGVSNGLTAPVLEQINGTGRNDVVLAYVDGVPTLNQILNENGSVARNGDMIRLNRAAGTFGQWPNGRGLTDDVVATALRVLAECQIQLAPTVTIGRYGASTINCALDDAVTSDDKTLGNSGQTSTFPYVGIPHSGYGQQN